ncbi:MAG TPA: glycosyltransferase family 2 protein [Bacillota bacterium]|nr:glycosyltransferase family 2 protein [Bacillota bacterium]HPZ11558.1 glycosyltransferase family 2 protein [Bacillota bacterium]HQE09544.1 glycosyltransferase family 2 protein [Bacillota bacterium]
MSTVYCLCMIKNEADIIESYLRYHLHIFDGIVILDNGSTDRTMEIISLMQKEGLPIEVKEDDSLAFAQGDKTTELIDYTFKHFAPDLIFPLDVDEFLTAPASPENPRRLIDRLQTGKKIYYLERDYTYFPVHINEKELFIPRRITYASPIKDYWPKVVVSREIWETTARSSPAATMIFCLTKGILSRKYWRRLKYGTFPTALWNRQSQR